MVTTNWPVKLFWLPFGSTVSISLGPVSSSFLCQKRLASLQRKGCYAAVDDKRPDGDKTPPSRNKSGRSSPREGCSKGASLRRKARTCVRFLEKELRLKRARALPSRIECGHLRSAIRSCFDHLNEIGELSVKTSQKLEKSYCPSCESTTVARQVDKWKEERFGATEVDDAHLAQFAAQLGKNIERGWNRGKWPYIPNGHACLGVSRSDGGTWIPGEFSTECSVQSVVSAGKPRIVTLFSERNNSILYPLHHSLYSNLKRKEWLLVGDPTNKAVSSLNGCAYISVDYSQATDRIKVAYTRAAIEELIDKGEGLSDDDIRALRVVGRLRIDGTYAERGQPMGSLMSFPLLCLINKTVVDLALNDLLIEGKVTFKEWTRHRCLINGDDLLTREVGAGGLLNGIRRHGSRVGLVLNEEKTMVDAEKGEINSTLFINGIRQKKINLSALFMGRDVSDVLGFASQSALTEEGFLFLARRARFQLSTQKEKLQQPLSAQQFNALVRCKELRQPLLSVPVEEPKRFNPFPVVSKPVGYDLSRGEEVDLIRLEVDRLRSRGYIPSREKLPVKTVGSVGVSLRAAIKRNKPIVEDAILDCLERGWKRKMYLLRETPSVDIVPYEHVCDECADKGLAHRLVCEIRELKRTTWLPLAGCQVPGTEGPLGDWMAL